MICILILLLSLISLCYYVYKCFIIILYLFFIDFTIKYVILNRKNKEITKTHENESFHEIQLNSI